MAEVKELYKEILHEVSWHTFNPADNSLPAGLADKAKTLFFKGDVEFLEKLKVEKTPEEIGRAHV